MGTRNLTMVIDQKGVTKVCQYGQWDGYPSGVGARILTFLKDEITFNKFIDKLDKVRFLYMQGIDKEFVDNFNNTPSDKRSGVQTDWYNNFIHRDLAEDVLTNIAYSDEDEILLIDSSDDDNWIEWVYVINLSDETFTVQRKLNEDPLKVYSLKDLPEEESFINDFR